MPLSACTDAVAAAWVREGVREFDYTVGSIVPAVFDAYARVFHPPSRGMGDDAVEVRWGEVAAANGRVMHPAAEWGSLTGSWQLREQAGVWDQEPSIGDLPEAVAAPLVRLLGEHALTPERCRFGLWEGRGAPSLMFLFSEGTPEEEQERHREAAWADMDAWRALLEGAPRLELPERTMWLLEGPLSAIEDFYVQHRDAPNIWWPDDRAWCVATEIDLMTTYVGGARALIDAIVADHELEALPVADDQLVTWEADTINPLPAPP
ncbi:MAG TPA: hypothetical protein VNZ01_00080 [Solirubrobacteraceae bacterium]|jgi:hypothetical protein|nr:hypothetical protein [Solirubrobacteraceae bacterium]